MSIFEREELIKRMEEMKQSNGRIFEATKKGLKGITLATAIGIMLSSSSAFAAEHTVTDWQSYKEAIISDILNQDKEIIIHYEGPDKYTNQSDLTLLVSDLYEEALADINGTLEENNIRNARLNTKGIRNGVDYILTTGTYNLTYKNSYQDLQEAQRIIDNFLEANIEESMSDYDKVMKIYEFIIDEYTYGYANTGNKTQDELNERNILLGLQGNPVVCEGYTMLFSKMASNLGYENKIIRGSVAGAGHSWNLIKIEDKWYHVDATWGDSGSEENKEKYFLTSDDVIEDKNNPTLRRTWVKSNYPASNEVYQNEDNSNEENDKIILAEEAIELAREHQTQELIDNALLIISELQDGEIKDNLHIMLDEIQEELDTHNEQITEATLAIDLAELNETQEMLDAAIELINNLPETELKNELLSRADLLQAIIDENAEEVEPEESEDDENEEPTTPEEPEDDEVEEPTTPEEPEEPTDDEVEEPVTPEEPEEPKDDEIEEPTTPEEPEEPEDDEIEEPVTPQEPEEPTDDKIDEPVIPKQPKEKPSQPNIPTKENNPSKPSKSSKEIIHKEKEKAKWLSIKNAEEINAMLNILPNANVDIEVNSQKIDFDVKPFIYNEKENKTLVPIRFIAEALGFEVDWARRNGNIMVFMSNNEGKGIVLNVGRNYCYINGNVTVMNIVPEIHDNITYVSIEAIIDILESRFKYEYNNRTITFNITQ